MVPGAPGRRPCRAWPPFASHAWRRWTERTAAGSIAATHVPRPDDYPLVHMFQVPRKIHRLDSTPWATAAYAVTSLTAEQATPIQLAVWACDHGRIEMRLPALYNC